MDREFLLKLIIIFALMPALVSCDPAEPITFINETDQSLAFYVKSDIHGDLLAPHSSLETSVFLGGGNAWESVRVAATREDGQWVFDQKWTRKEFEKVRNTIVVSSLTPIPPPSHVNVAPSENFPKPVSPLQWIKLGHEAEAK